MRRAPCPRCARPGGVPIAYGLPDLELMDQAERGEVHLGGCVMFADAATIRCRFCGRQWREGPLPAWWPAEDVDEMDPGDRERARAELTDLWERSRGVAAAVEFGGVDAVRDAAAALPPDNRLGIRVVPSDCVLVAEALDALDGVCRAVTEDEIDLVVAGRFGAARRAVDEFRTRGWVDVLREDDVHDDGEEEDDWADAWLTDEDRFERLVGDGEGSQLPSVGDDWNDELDALAAEELGDGSGVAWARYVWSYLRLPPITTELDMARARIRVVALGVLRRGFLDRLAGDSLDEWWFSAGDPVVAPYYVGYLAAAEDADPGADHDPDGPDEEVVSQAVREIVRVECERLGPALAGDVGVSRFFAHTWASRFRGARYPLSMEAQDEAVNGNSTPEKHIAFEWVADGMPL